MSSWVAPAVAAEIWGVSLEEVMEYIANGRVPSRTDGRFLFVDVGANGLPIARDENDCPEQSIVTPQELTALAGDQTADADLPPEIAQWREARCRTSRLRRPPSCCAD
jgi:hypothetical protein